MTARRLVVLSGVFFVPPAFAQVQTADQQKCTVAMGKALQKVASTLGTDVTTCLKDGAKGKLTSAVEICLGADANGAAAGWRATATSSTTARSTAAVAASAVTPARSTARPACSSSTRRSSATSSCSTVCRRRGCGARQRLPVRVPRRVRRGESSRGAPLQRRHRHRVPVLPELPVAPGGCTDAWRLSLASAGSTNRFDPWECSRLRGRRDRRPWVEETSCASRHRRWF